MFIETTRSPKNSFLPVSPAFIKIAPPTDAGTFVILSRPPSPRLPTSRESSTIVTPDSTSTKSWGKYLIPFALFLITSPLIPLSEIKTLAPCPMIVKGIPISIAALTASVRSDSDKASM